MALNDSLVYALPVEVVSNAVHLIWILQALGGVLIFYIIFSLINMILNRKKKEQLEKIASMVEEIRDHLRYTPKISPPPSSNTPPASRNNSFPTLDSVRSTPKKDNLTLPDKPY